MPISLITTALSQAGTRLLESLFERARDYGDALDSTAYVIVEHWLQDSLENSDLPAAFDQAQDEFRSYAATHERWLEHFADLLRYSGSAQRPFTEGLWQAFLFGFQGAADALWDIYPELQRSVTIETGRTLPRSWGDWIIPMQTFMDIVEQCLIDQTPVFEDLFVCEEILHLLEALPVREPASARPAGINLAALHSGHFNEATLTAYLTACSERIGHIDPRGYPRSVHTTVPLSDVYIPLRLVPLSAYDKPVYYMRYQLAGHEDSELRTFREPLGYRELENCTGEMVNEVLTHHPQVLILGDSGAGKTTLLRHLVFEHARILLESQPGSPSPEGGEGTARNFRLTRPLPIYIDLADFVEDHHADETLEDFMLRTAIELTGDEGVGSLLAALIENGQCLLLLDGLDQAASDDQRRMLVASITEASMGWRATGNRTVVTSRFVGYHTTPLPRDFAAYIIQPLERSQINSLLLRWKLTLTRVQRPLVGDDEVLRQAHSDTLALARQITGNPRLYTLGSNPLLLRMLVGVFHPGMVLVPQQVAIYQTVAEALIREWRLPQGSTSPPSVLEQEATPLLAELAFWMQASRPTGMLREHELREILGRIWSQMHPEASPQQVSDAIGDFLGRMRVHSGVLIELAPQRYGFIYHGLQEYFAARYLVSSYRLAAQRIRERLHDPRWDEVITLAVGFTSLRSVDDATELVEAAILARGERAAQFGHASSPFESLLKRDLFFAARLLGSGVEVRAELTREIVRQLMQLWLEGDRDSLGRFSLIYDRARRHLVNLNGTPASHRALQIAIDNLAAPDEHIQAFAADAVTFWPAHLVEGRDALVAHGREAPLLVRRAIVEALGRVGSLSREAYVLLLMLTSDPDEQVCTASQRTLEAAAPIPYEVLNMWVDFLHSDDPVRRRVSLRRLKQAGSLPPQVVGELLRLLDDDDPVIRQRAVDTLANVSNLPDDAMAAICRAIAEAEPPVRVMAINALARPIELPSGVISQLARWTDDPDVGVRLAAAMALGTCRNETPEVLAALVERLDDPADSVRAAVVEPLARKGWRSAQATHALAHMISDPIYHVRRAVAAALRHVPELNDDLRHALYVLLSDREMLVRETTLETIRHLKDPGPEIIDYLMALAAMPDHPIGLKAIRALAALRGLSNQALLVLVQALRTHWENAGREIVACLQAHAPLPPEVINHVMDLAVQREFGSSQARRAAVGLRALALEVLGQALDNTSAVLQILLDATNPAESPHVRAAALRSLAHARTVGSNTLHILREHLKNGTGEVRRAAAITLGHLIRNLPDPPLSGEDMLAVARDVADALVELTPHASWEAESRAQDELLWALNWIVERARPAIPRLPARAESE